MRVEVHKKSMQVFLPKFQLKFKNITSCFLWIWYILDFEAPIAVPQNYCETKLK